MPRLQNHAAASGDFFSVPHGTQASLS
jgi:hypothetical protein